jgi:hypothetical protein
MESYIICNSNITAGSVEIKFNIFTVQSPNFYSVFLGFFRDGGGESKVPWGINSAFFGLIYLNKNIKYYLIAKWKSYYTSLPPSPNPTIFWKAFSSFDASVFLEN